MNKSQLLIGIAFTVLIGLLPRCSGKKEDKVSTMNILGGVVNKIMSLEHYENALTVAGSKLILVDLYAEWCKPCHMLAPILEEIANEQRHRIIVLKVNVDRLPSIARSFNVQGIPLVVFIKNRQPLGSIVGLYPKQSYLDAIERYSQ